MERSICVGSVSRHINALNNDGPNKTGSYEVAKWSRSKSNS